METVVQRRSERVNTKHTTVAHNWRNLVWIFAVMSVVGLIGETIQHYVAFGEWESRAGFIWGPFSPIYGLAAVLLTAFLEPFEQRPGWFLFFLAALVGGGLEYFASWAMETFWGVVAWSYLDMPFNFDGRTDIFHCAVWGTLGLLWVRIGIPICDKIFSHINLAGKPYRILTAILSMYLALNIVVTVTVLLRADERAHGDPPRNTIEQYYDYLYNDEYLQKRFHNMGGLGQA